MSLRIDVRTPPQLIERAREQQQQQRLAMVERQRQARVRKEAERQVVRERLLTGRNEKGEKVTDGIEMRRREWFGAQAVRRGHPFFAIIDANGEGDDVFEIIVNGVRCGIADLTEPSYIGYMFGWTLGEEEYKAAEEAISWVLYEGTRKVNFQSPQRVPSSRPALNAPASFRMRNIKFNYNGNWGYVVCGTVDRNDLRVRIQSPLQEYGYGNDEEFFGQLRWSNLIPITPGEPIPGGGIPYEPLQGEYSS